MRFKLEVGPEHEGNALEFPDDVYEPWDLLAIFHTAMHNITLPGKSRTIAKMLAGIVQEELARQGYDNFGMKTVAPK